MDLDLAKTFKFGYVSLNHTESIHKDFKGGKGGFQGVPKKPGPLEDPEIKFQGLQALGYQYLV